MELNEYQQESRKTAIYPQVFIRDKLGNLVEANWVYPALGLGGETGETLEKIKKLIRDSRGLISPESREAVKKELGDVLWYIAQIATEFNLTLGDIGGANLQKLRDRQAREVLVGSGDNR